MNLVHGPAVITENAVIGWAIWRGDDDATDVVQVRQHDQTLLLNGLYPSRLEALEGALSGAVADLKMARSRVRKLRSRWRRAFRQAAIFKATSTEQGERG